MQGKEKGKMIFAGEGRGLSDLRGFLQGRKGNRDLAEKGWREVESES